jgi:hypothetical protein
MAIMDEAVTIMLLGALALAITVALKLAGMI